MRTLLPLAALLCLGAVPSAIVTAADAVPAAAAAVPAANQSLLEHCLSLASQLADATHKGADIAQKAAGLPFAGASAKANADAAASKSNDAAGLLSDVKSLQSGQAPAANGTLAQAAAGTLNLGERFKGLPGAATLQQIFAVPGLGDALLKNLPVDKVPGFDAIKSLLGK